VDIEATALLPIVILPLGCHDVCPKNLPLATQIAFLRRKMVAIGWK
jgi:succinate dehydrogenase/fumarate reductase-like Fe-S protein